MANFTYSASGKLCCHAFSPALYHAFYYTRYAERDVVYDLRRARTRGQLRPVAIKRLYFVDPQISGGEVRVLYIDTLNSWWNEGDLVTHAEAIAAAQAYWQGVAEQASRLVKEIHGGCR